MVSQEFKKPTMKRKAQITLFVFVIGFAFASCRSSKPSCAAYDQIEMTQEK